jgi:hypothetical protein
MAKIYGRPVFYRPPCKSRRCCNCAPKVIAAKLSRLPDAPVYGEYMNRQEWDAKRKWLERERKAGREGDFTKIPMGPDLFFVVSDAEIGFCIDEDTIEEAMYGSRSEWGNITSSKAWRVTETKNEHTEGFEDLGVVTASLQWIEGKASQRGLEKHENDAMLLYNTTRDSDVEWLAEVAGVVSDSKYWADLHSRADRPELERMLAFVDRVCISRAS